MSVNYSAVLFSAGLDSAVLLAEAAAARTGPLLALYVSVGFAWEREERDMAARLLATAPFDGVEWVELSFDMRDVFPASHWAVRGTPPGFDTPDEDVYLDGRNLILLSKAGVYMARRASGSEAGVTFLLGPLAGNPFPDATPEFFAATARTLSLGLAMPVAVETPFAAMQKADVIRRGGELGVALELTMSCMNPKEGLHCGECSKCRERSHAFAEAGVPDPTPYRAHL